MAVPWSETALFMAGVVLLTLYALTASGHFPAEARAQEFRAGPGALILWGTMVAACLAAIAVLVVGLTVLPWYAIAIGGGAMLLAAPLLLQPLPDSFLNGRGGLLTFAAGASLVAIAMWARA